jgi:hypothetical protein
MWTGDGVPLDFGRRRREASRDQEVALAVQYGGCAWPDCPSPATGCHAHHDDEWDADDGPTALDNPTHRQSHPRAVERVHPGERVAQSGDLGALAASDDPAPALELTDAAA